MDTSTKEKDEEETTPADEETFPEEASEAEDAQLEDELAAKEAAAENEAASVPPDDPTMYLSVPKLGISGYSFWLSLRPPRLTQRWLHVNLRQ
jgi:hypothetical protein